MVDEATKIDDAVAWNKLISTFPNCHVLQSWQWGEIKQKFGWTMHPMLWKNASGMPGYAALLLERRLSISRLQTPLRIYYSPRGPLVDWTDEPKIREVMGALENMAGKSNAISIKIDPAVTMAAGVPGEPEYEKVSAGTRYQEILEERGWIYSPAQVQFRNTVLVDLNESEEEMLLRMKQKTRYNIRLATRKGVTIRQGNDNDLDLVYKMYLETALRDGFVIRSETYYRTLWGNFLNEGLAKVLLAEFENQPLGGLIMFLFGKSAWYFYGMSNQLHSEKMPNYLLQWEAMRLAKKMNCQVYDMWGAPEIFDKTDGMWGVYRFKSGFGGTVIHTPGAFDYAPRKGIYTLFNRILPRLLRIMRSRRINQAQQELG